MKHTLIETFQIGKKLNEKIKNNEEINLEEIEKFNKLNSIKETSLSKNVFTLIKEIPIVDFLLI